MAGAEYRTAPASTADVAAARCSVEVPERRSSGWWSASKLLVNRNEKRRFPMSEVYAFPSNGRFEHRCSPDTVAILSIMPC